MTTEHKEETDIVAWRRAAVDWQERALKAEVENTRLRNRLSGFEETQAVQWPIVTLLSIYVPKLRRLVGGWRGKN